MISMNVNVIEYNHIYNNIKISFCHNIRRLRAESLPFSHNLSKTLTKTSIFASVQTKDKKKQFTKKITKQT